MQILEASDTVAEKISNVICGFKVIFVSLPFEQKAIHRDQKNFMFL